MTAAPVCRAASDEASRRARSAETRAASAQLMTHSAEEAAAQQATAAVQAKQKAVDTELKAARLQAQLEALQQDLRARTRDSQQQLQVSMSHAWQDRGWHGPARLQDLKAPLEMAGSSCRWAQADWDMHAALAARPLLGQPAAAVGARLACRIFTDQKRGLGTISSSCRWGPNRLLDVCADGIQCSRVYSKAACSSCEAVPSLQ